MFMSTVRGVYELVGGDRSDPVRLRRVSGINLNDRGRTS